MLFTLMLLQATPALALSCGGTGIANKADTATIYAGENSGNSAWPTMHATNAEPFEAEVEVRLAGEESRIRLPAPMLPSTEEKQGWSKLKIVRATDEGVTGSARVTLMSNPRVHFDRSTGIIKVAGASGRYEGVCRTVESRS